MGRSILVVLLAKILAIYRVSNNPIPSACQSLIIIFAPCRMLLPSHREQGGGGGGKGHAKLLNCSKLTVTEVR